ncbi:MAG: segregation/condensation protein A [Phycisphaerales bacterium]|nr:MAG: segregation/condensation protein A [Phycisphaerales bacterium]
MSGYRVQLDTYNGPLDLLYYLVRQEEVDIYDIPIARITEQYIQYVNLLKELDPDGVADYLVLLATLIEIKSRMLLPRVPAEEDQPEDLGDPRMDLVRRLLEYKKYKDAAYELAEAADEQAKRFPPRPVRISADQDAAELEDLAIWDLMAAFNKLMAQIGQGPVTHDVVYDDTPMALHAADIVDRLQREDGSLSFERVFLGRGREEIIGLFLALLEMIRQKRVRAEQEGLFGMIVIRLLDATPLELVQEETAALPESLQAESAEPGEATETHRAEDEPDEDLLGQMDEEEEEMEADAELHAIDTALDQIANRLEVDRRQRKEADRTASNSTEGSGETA